MFHLKPLSRHVLRRMEPVLAVGAMTEFLDRFVERLAAVKKRYDPTNMFRFNHNVRPA